jgi:hypothetical protein
MIKKSNSFGANPFIFGKLLSGPQKKKTQVEVKLLYLVEREEVNDRDKPILRCVTEFGKTRYQMKISGG